MQNLNISMPIIQTLEDNKKLVRARLIDLVTGLQKHLVADRTALLYTVWTNGRGLTPQEVLASVDPADAAKLTIADVLIRTLLNYADPNSAPSPIPPAYECTLKDANDVAVTFDAELIALVTKLSQVAAIEITAAPVPPQE